MQSSGAAEDSRLVARFKKSWKRVGQCHIWQKCVGGDGYGQIRWRNRNYKAHRISWMIANGDLPDEMALAHTCDNPKCVNPLHLFPCSQADNLRDMSLKGRHGGRSHEENSQAKLDWEKVDQIRTAHDLGYAHEDIAEVFQVSLTTIQRIIKKETWKEDDRPARR